MTKPTLSIVIPCYNEEEGIPYLAEQLLPTLTVLGNDYTVEPIFVDDGSIDKTNQLLHQYFSLLPNVIIAKHERNKNVGAALKTGFARASGELIVALDSDCTYPPAIMIPMIKLIDSTADNSTSTADIVTASPYHPQGKVNNVPKYRLFLSKSASRLYKLLLGSPIYTYTAMVRVYKKEVIQEVRFEADHFLGVTELLVKALLRGYRVKELPTELNARKFGVSKMKMVPLRVIGNHLGLMTMIIREKWWRGSRGREEGRTGRNRPEREEKENQPKEKVS